MRDVLLERDRPIDLLCDRGPADAGGVDCLLAAFRD